MLTRREVLKRCGASSALLACGSTLRAFPAQSQGWRVTGAEAPRLAAVSTRVRRFMQEAGVSAGQLAIHVDGQPVLNQAFTQGAHPTVQPTSLFRIASCSKIFTCAAVDTLHKAGRIDMASRVFPLLGITKAALPKQRPSHDIDRITVQHLVDHAGGWNAHGPCTAKNGQKIPGANWDAVFSIRQIARELSLPGLPTKLDLARYMYGQPLQFIPGTQDFESTGGNSYSNIGYVLLGLVVEHVSGRPFVDFVRSAPLTHDGTTDVFLAHTNPRGRQPREVWYEDAGRGPSALEPLRDVVVPNPYGGEGYVTELMDSGGGLVTTAGTLARFIGAHASWGLGGRAGGASRSGSMAGTSSYVMSRRDGVDCAVIFNTRSFKGDHVYDDFIKDIYKFCDTKALFG